MTLQLLIIDERDVSDSHRLPGRQRRAVVPAVRQAVPDADPAEAAHESCSRGHQRDSVRVRQEVQVALELRQASS